MAFVFFFATTAHSATRSIGRVQIKQSSGEQVTLYKKSYALLIGASSYQRGWPSLAGVKKDIDAVSIALKKHGFEVRIVFNPTGEKLRQSLRDFVRDYGREPANRLLIYYAGHGHTLAQAYGGEMGYIVPVDSPNPEQDKNGFLDTAVDMQEMSVLARRIQSSHALFLFDSCFSGSVFALSRAIPKSISYKTSRPVRQFITSGSANEEVPDESIFRQQFIAALDGEADGNKDGYVTGNELGMFLQDKVINYSNESQHPQFGKIRDPKLDKGDFVFEISGKIKFTPIKPQVEAEEKPSLPPETGTISDFDERIKAREEVKRKWLNWHEKMETAYTKVEGYDKSSVLKSHEKIKAWQDFLSAFSSDNPNSSLDEQYRKTVAQRIDRWKVAQLKGDDRQEEKTKESVMPNIVSGPSGADDIIDSVTKMKFEYVRGDCFVMGSMSSEKGRDSDETKHQVCVDGFYIGKYEVTNRQYRLYAQDHNSGMYKGKSLNDDNQPVVNISRQEAVAFTNWLSKKSGKNYRLPTEAQWEFGCRGVISTNKYCGGNDLDDLAWHGRNSGGATHEVGDKKSNKRGIYDMSGNVWEYCLDKYYAHYYKQSPLNNPTGPLTGEKYVVRGGSWLGNANNLRAANRYAVASGKRRNDLGFRLVLHGVVKE